MTDAQRRAEEALAGGWTHEQLVERVADVDKKAEQRGREGGIRDAIKVQDPYTAGELAGKELLAPWVEHHTTCVHWSDALGPPDCDCGLTAALKKQPKVTLIGDR